MRTLFTSGLAISAMMLAAGSASAVNINLSGDLGVNNWHTPSVPLPVGQTLAPVPIFQSVPGVGDLTADVIADNTGVSPLGNTIFSLRITNLVFQAYAAMPTTPTYVNLTVGQVFGISTPGVQHTSQSIDGVMSATGNCVVIGNTEIGAPLMSPLGTLLPLVSFGGGAGGNVDPFNVGPTIGSYTAGSLNVFMEIQLELYIYGNGFVNMPTSFDAVTEATPAPGAAMVLVMAGGFGALRRRRGVAQSSPA